MKTVFIIIAAMALALACAGFAFAESADADEPSLIYEAIFLDNEEITSLFKAVRGEEAPHAIMTQDFHVTTAFMPETDMSAFYGTKVAIHIYAYKDGEVTADDGSLTANEGFFCTVETEDPELQDYLNSLEKNWHITGSYMHQGGAKYTGFIDPADGLPLDLTVYGCLGGYFANGEVRLK